MPRRVQTPDGVTHEFPDDATDAEISAALNAPPPTARGPVKASSWTDVAVNALPAIGGMVGGALGMASGIPSLGLTSAPAAVAGAAALGAGGEAAKQLINRARGNAAPSTPMAAAAPIAGEAALQGGLEYAGGKAAELVGKGARAVYRGYLKPSLSKVNLPKAKAIVDTAFQEGLPVAESAVGEARSRIQALRTRVDSLLQDATGDVDLSAIANKVRQWAHRMFDQPGRAPEDLKAALAVADRIDQHPSVVSAAGEPATTSVAGANAVKRNLQESVGEQFGVTGSRAATKAAKYGAFEARKAVEGGAKAGGVTADIHGLNLRESKLIDLARSLERATGREANRNALFGVPSVLSGLAGGEEYARTRNPYSAATTALALRVGLAPEVATRAALLAGRLAGHAGSGTAIADVARAAVQAVLEAQRQPESGPDHAQHQ